MRASIVIVVLAACGGGEGGALSSRAITADEALPLCMANCDHLVACGGFPEPACAATCSDRFVGWARADAIQTLLECATALPCGEIDLCSFEVQPLAIHREWEAGCRANLGACVDDLDFACGVSPDPQAEIVVGSFRFFAPEIMTEIIACLDEPGCDASVDCVGGVLEAHDVEFL